MPLYSASQSVELSSNPEQLAMSRTPLVLLALFVVVPLFLTGALHRSPVHNTPPPVFVPNAVALPNEWKDAGVATLFDRAIERLSPERLAWLHVIVWQRMAVAEVPFESTGALQIGPDHCVRFDLAIHAGASPGHRLVVSDGRCVAQVVRLGKAEPTVTCCLLVPEGLGGRQPPPKNPAETLRDLGCGGPYPLLKDLHGKLKELSMQSGLLQGRPQVRVQGRLSPAPRAAEPATAVAADFCYLYLDAQTLWPGRLEWWAAHGARDQRLLLEIEFRDPQLNRPLSLPECIRAFSYRPEQG
jgi:hypothetical protein